MVLIRNIKIDDQNISADCYREGRAFDVSHIVLSRESFEVKNGVKRDAYIAHAIRELKRVYQNFLAGKGIPEKAMSMWY